MIALTADVQMAQRETYTRHGFDECLLKPVSLGQLRGLLMRWRLLEDDGAEENNNVVVQDQQAGAAIDRMCLIENIGAIDDNTIEMLGMFAEMTQPLIEKIRVAQEDNNAPELSELGHSLKGAARSACCTVLGDLASRLQDDAARGKTVWRSCRRHRRRI